MKVAFKESVKAIFKDKAVLSVIAALLVVSIATAIYFAIKLNASDLQVSVKYTVFGTENVYRAHWTYMLSFVGFSLVVGILHTVIIAKLHRLKGKRFAVFFGWCSVALLLFAWLLLSQIINVAGRN